MKEDILTKALEQALNESFNEMIDQDIPDYAFSPEFKEKMDVLIHDQQTVPEKKRSRMLWFSAMAAAAALICVTAGLTYNYRPKRIPEPQNDIITEDDTTTSPTRSRKIQAVKNRAEIIQKQQAPQFQLLSETDPLPLNQQLRRMRLHLPPLLFGRQLHQHSHIMQRLKHM